MKNLTAIQNKLKKVKGDNNLSFIFKKGHSLYLNAQIIPLSRSEKFDDFLVADQYEDFKVRQFYDQSLSGKCSCKSQIICPHQIASLFQAHEDMARLEETVSKPGIAYTREGMIKRVLQERFEKAKKAKYKIIFTDNKYGEHILINEQEKSYKLTFHDLKQRTGYCSCPDYRKNKLGTCKHLIWTYLHIQRNPEILDNKNPDFPFVEIYRNPLNDYKISWYYPGRVPEPEVSALLYRYFGKELELKPEMEEKFLHFLQAIEEFKQVIVREEVYSFIEQKFHEKILREKRLNHKLDYSILNVTPYDFQKKGIEFLTFRERSILADEIGLGKTYQSIAAAWFKHQILGFNKCLIVCPAPLIPHWASEIERFTAQKACILNKQTEKRTEQYQNASNYFFLINYEKLNRDKLLISNFAPDLLILDEAQRLKSYDSQLVHLCQSIPFKHIIALSGTPIETNLNELYSLVNIVDAERLSPLWEFSYKHYYFDSEKEDKIVGYHSVDKLIPKLKPILLRRTRSDVVKELPKLIEINVPVPMQTNPLLLQKEYLLGIQKILDKNLLTLYDMQAIYRIFAKLRMIANAPFLIHGEPSETPKLEELHEILFNKLNIKEFPQKVVIFSEWKSIHLMITKMLRLEDIKFIEINNDTSKEEQIQLIGDFQSDKNFRVLLSSLPDNAELDIPDANTIINFDIPWRKNAWKQRIGILNKATPDTRQVRLINLISTPSIEPGIKTEMESFDSIFSPFLDTEKPNQLELFPSNDSSPKWLSQLVVTLIAEMENNSNFHADSKNIYGLGNYAISFLQETKQKVNNIKLSEEETEMLIDPDVVENDNDDNLLRSGLKLINELIKQSRGKEIFSEEPIIEPYNDGWRIILKR